MMTVRQFREDGEEREGRMGGSGQFGDTAYSWREGVNRGPCRTTPSSPSSLFSSVNEVDASLFNPKRHRLLLKADGMLLM